MIDEPCDSQLETSVDHRAFRIPSDRIAEILPKPSPVVLLTGAGASAPLDMPTMKEFRESFSKQLACKLKAQWNSVVQLTAKYYDGEVDDIDIEQVLTYVESCLFSYVQLAGLWRKTLRGDDRVLPTIEELEKFRQSLWILRMSILDGICKTYAEPDPSKTVECYEPLFKMLTETAGQSTTNVFTTNYDLTFETLARERPNGYELSDGFRKVTSGKEVWKGDYLPKCQSEHSIVLWKLHGSTSWKVNEEKEELRKDSPSIYRQDGDTTVIIYPTKTKADTQELFARPFNQAYGSLESLFMQVGVVKVLLVIGYGFGDDELRRDIQNGLAAEDKAMLIVVDPGADICELSNSFPEVSTERIRVINSYFGEDDTIEAIRSSLEELLNYEIPQAG